MQSIVHIAADIAITGEIAEKDLAEIAQLGFRSVVNNRVEGEDANQLSSQAEAALAWRNGMRYRHVPASKLELFTDPVVEGMAEAIAHLPRPILLHCKSGMRSAIVWAAAEARHRAVDDVLTALATAGYDLDFLRDELDSQADRRHWMPAQPAPVEPTPAGGELAA